MSNPFAPLPEPESSLARYRILSSTAGIRVSPLQLGAMSIGDAWSSMMGSMSKADSFALLDAYTSAGGNFIDTANTYQNEQSEQWLGEWMSARANRDRMTVATKYTMAYKDYAIGKGVAPNYMGNHKKAMTLSLRDSLEKLQATYIDIFYVHLWDHSCSIKEVMDSLHMLIEQGRVLYLGISDTPAWIVAAANEYAVSNGKTPFSIYQGKWSVMMRDFERDILPMARHYGMALAPWGAMGQGKFQTKKQIGDREKNGEALRSFMGPGQTDDEVKISAALERVAVELSQGMEKPYSVSAVALAYVLAKAPRVFPVVGGRKVEHLMDNVRALEIRLSKEQIQELESALPFDIGFPSNFIGEDPKVSGTKGGHVLAAGAYVDWLLSEKPVGYA